MFLFSHLVYLQAATCDPDPNLMLVIWNIIMYSNLFSLICLPISLSFFHVLFQPYIVALSRLLILYLKFIWALLLSLKTISYGCWLHYHFCSQSLSFQYCVKNHYLILLYFKMTYLLLLCCRDLTKFFCYCGIFACPFNLSKYTKHGRIIYTYRWISNTHCLFLRNWMMLVICSSCEDILCSFISGPCKKHNICIRRSLVLRIILERSFFVFSPCSPCRSTFLYWNSVGYSFLRGTKAFELVSDPVTCNYLCSKLYNVFGSY